MNSSNARAPSRASSVDPRRVEHDERVVAVERALFRIDRDERDARLTRFLARREHAVGVALVVVDDRLLLDGDRRGVRERRAAYVVAEPVVEERHRDVAVVDDRRLDAARELLHLGSVQVFEREVGRLAGRGVVLRDRRRQRARREVRVGLAEPERPPLRDGRRRPSRRGRSRGAGCRRSRSASRDSRARRPSVRASRSRAASA